MLWLLIREDLSPPSLKTKVFEFALDLCKLGSGNGHSSRSSSTSSWPGQHIKPHQNYNLKDYLNQLQIVVVEGGVRGYWQQKCAYSSNRNLQPNKDFKSIINSPLSSGESSDHNNTERKPTGKETHDPYFLHGLHNRRINPIKTWRVKHDQIFFPNVNVRQKMQHSHHQQLPP